MFDFDQVLQFIRLDSGHNLIQCVLLFMIWLKSGKILKALEKRLGSLEEKVDNHEGRIVLLEKLGGK